MTYSVKECFVSLQGEGIRTGRVAVFCRMAGCNLWSGKEQDRSTATCSFCDTDFNGIDSAGGGRFASATALSEHIQATWNGRVQDPRGKPYVVFTGGEPLLQLDPALVDACHERGFEVAIETNGTLPSVDGVDWICVSPKSIDRMVLRSGHELKLVYPQEGLDPALFEQMQFEHFLLQPMDGASRKENTRACIEFCLAHPKWRLSLQTHKYIGIP
ncbi:MAG: 7-carboxy-7-deazaguanine synthase [Deltaproteobacteria bacterium]|nr:7-carboxy-7-deazaguanine synthase [Deltaproteobacteria bacterium]